MVVEREITYAPLLCNWVERDGVRASFLPSEAEFALSCRDGAPYCEKDYQGLFGVKCEACHQFITGKVLEVSHTWAPLRATVMVLTALGNTRGSLFFHLFLTCGGKKVVAGDRSLRKRLCNTVFSGSVYFMLETGRIENMREKRIKKSLRNYVGGTVILNCSYI